MKALFNLVKSPGKSFKPFGLVTVLLIFFSSCINNKKIETYRNTGEQQYQDLIKQMEAKYNTPKTDSIKVEME